MLRALSAVKKFLSAVPDEVHCVALAAMFNHALRGQEVTTRFEEVDGKSVLLRIDDVPCQLHFRFERRRLRPCRGSDPDVIIAGNLESFMRLASREEDPDTLFFTRQLIIEGETETGLHIKNLLDSLEYDLDAHFNAVLPAPLSHVAKRLSRVVREPVSGLRERIFH